MKTLFFLLSLFILATQSNADDWDATYACPAGNTIGFVVTGATNEPVRWSWVGKIRVVTNATATVAASPTYLIKQNFEGAGYDNSESWTAAGTGTKDPDYTSVALEGSQSLRLAGSSQTATDYAAFATNGEVWVYFLFRPVALPGATRQIMKVTDGAGTSQAYVEITATGTLRLNGSGSFVTTGAMTAGTTYHVWCHFKKVAVANDAVTEVAFSTDGTKPTTGDNYKIQSNGTWSADMARLYLGSAASDTFDWLYDKVRVDDVEITQANLQ